MYLKRFSNAIKFLVTAKKSKMKFGALYAQTSIGPRNDAILYLDRYSHLLKWQSYPETVLDVGCGDGSVTVEVLFPYLKGHLRHLEAVDVSEAMIQHAKAHNALGKVRYQTVDIDKDEEVRNLSMKFDHIFSFYCIHWVLDQKSLFKRFYDVLNPGGQIFITTLSDSSLHKTFKKHLREGTWAKYLPNTSGFTDYSNQPEKYMTDLLEKLGFEVQLCKTELRDTPFDDFKGFVRSLVSVHRFFELIPEELREEYVQDHIRSNCEFSIYLEASGNYSWTYEAFIIVAVKK